MKKLKKFNENWIDDETEDTDRRMSELDSKEGLNDEPDINNEEEEEEELIYKIHRLLDEYRDKLTPEQISTVLMYLSNNA